MSWQGSHPSCRHPSTLRLLFHSSPRLPSAAQVPDRATAVKTQHVASSARAVHSWPVAAAKFTAGDSAGFFASSPFLSASVFPLSSAAATGFVHENPVGAGVADAGFSGTAAAGPGVPGISLTQLCHIWPPHSDTAAYACFFLAVSRAPSRTNNRYLQTSFLQCGRVVHTAPPAE